MSADLVVRGGTVVDGTGSPGVRADVAIPPGGSRVSAPTSTATGRSTPSGCVVAPGFIDIHTHYDAQVFWDPGADAVVLPRGHDRRGGQLRLLDRPHPARAPQPHRPHPRKRRGHERRQRWPRASPGTSRPSPSTSDRWAGGAPRSTSPPTSATPPCGCSSWATTPSSGRRRPRRWPGCRPSSARRCDAGAAGLGHQLRHHPPGRRRPTHPEPARRPGRSSRRFSRRAGRPARGVVAVAPGEQCGIDDLYELQPRVGIPFTYGALLTDPTGTPSPAGGGQPARAGRPAPRCGRR